ncbi:hypothetical protein JEQ12_004094 [Ovis aries]|uniref:Uncharacterized protein n=1 Tax=Ovis aries TaxID=9940 RepID=A0A836CZT4_SHEEP|nr:hypothetical protein JEQ12_004094 [Ovis aries]
MYQSISSRHLRDYTALQFPTCETVNGFDADVNPIDYEMSIAMYFPQNPLMIDIHSPSLKPLSSAKAISLQPTGEFRRLEECFWKFKYLYVYRSLSSMHVCRYTKHTGSMPDSHTFLAGVESSPYGVYATVCQVDRIIFCVFLEVDFKIYKKKMGEFFPADDNNEEEDVDMKEDSEGLEPKDHSPPHKKSKAKKPDGSKDSSEGISKCSRITGKFFILYPFSPECDSEIVDSGLNHFKDKRHFELGENPEHSAMGVHKEKPQPCEHMEIRDENAPEEKPSAEEIEEQSQEADGTSTASAPSPSSEEAAEVYKDEDSAEDDNMTKDSEETDHSVCDQEHPSELSSNQEDAMIVEQPEVTPLTDDQEENEGEREFYAVTEDSELNPNCGHTSIFTQHSEYACGKTQALQRIPPRDSLGEPGVPSLPCMDSKDRRLLSFHQCYVIEIKTPAIIRITLLLNLTKKEKSPNGELSIGQQRATPLGEAQGGNTPRVPVKSEGSGDTESSMSPDVDMNCQVDRVNDPTESQQED